MQAPHHRDLGNSRHVEYISGQKELVTFALGSHLHFRVVNQAQREGETSCPVSVSNLSIKKVTDCSNQIYFKNLG